MAQQLNFRKETLDNLDRVEPYGNSAAARAASETANMFARNAAQFSRLLGNHSQKQAVEEAKRYAFQVDPETGVPMLPEDEVRIGGLIANDTYQKALDVRYQDNLSVTLNDKLKRAEIKHPDNEEAYRQEAAVIVGAMAEKVHPNFRQVFLDQATEINTTTAANIAYRAAQKQRAAARAGARRNVGNLSRSQILRNATQEDYDAALNILLQDPNTQYLYEQNPDAVRKMLDKQVQDLIVEQYQNTSNAKPAPTQRGPSDTTPPADPTPPKNPEDTSEPAPQPAKTEVEQRVEVTNDENRYHGSNYLTTTKTELRKSESYVQKLSMPQNEFDAFVTGAKQSEIDDLWEAGVTDARGNNGDSHAFWTDPANLNPDLFDERQRRLLNSVENGFIPQAGQDVLLHAVSGEIPNLSYIDAATNLWSFMGNDMDRPGTFANSHPAEAGALDAVLELNEATYIQWESEEQKLERLNKRALSARETSNEKLAEILEMPDPKKATLANVRDEVSKRVNAGLSNSSMLGSFLGGFQTDTYQYQIDPVHTEQLVSRVIGYTRATQDPAVDKYVNKVVKQQTIEEEGFLTQTGRPVKRIMNHEHPSARIPMDDGDSMTYLQDVGARAVKMLLEVDVDPTNTSELAFKPTDDGYNVYVNGVRTSIELRTEDLNQLYRETVEYNREQLPREVEELKSQKNALLSERDSLWKRKWANGGNVPPEDVDRDLEVRGQISEIDRQIRLRRQTGEFSVFGGGDNGMIRALSDDAFVRFIQ